MTTFIWMFAVCMAARWGYFRGMRKEHEEPGSYVEDGGW